MKTNVIKHFASQLMKQPHSAAFIFGSILFPTPPLVGYLIKPDRPFNEQLLAGITTMLVVALVLALLYLIIRFCMWVYEDVLCAWERAKMISEGKGDEVERMEAAESQVHYEGP